MRLRSYGVLMLGLLLAGASTAWAQVATTGSIQVIVEDPQGGRLPGVTVQASAPDSVTTRQAVTDAEGVATLEALAPSARYIVRAQLSGFRDLERPDILVRTGQSTTLRVEMTLSTVTEQVTVTAQATPVVDTTRSVAGQDLTLRLTESLPTGRSYQAYLQLVPGVMPDSQTASGNPSSRSGMNWKDAGAASDFLGSSADNFYYFEGINVTDPVTGTFGSNLNVEIIQEQKVVTGGIPAEYVGAAGLISTVVTKSGSNNYSGSVNYFFQNDGLVAENKNLPDNQFNRYDSAFTLGGPILRNSLWAFGSYRYIKNVQDVNAQDTREFLREVDTVGKQSFFKTTWAPTQRDTLSFLFLNDPQTRSGSLDPTVVASRDRARDQGGNNYSMTYNRIFSNLLIEGAYSDHDAELTDIATDRTARNTVSFLSSTPRTLADEQLGGYGQDFPEFRPTKQFRASASYQWNQHRFKGGYEWARREDKRGLIYIPENDRSQYTSISSTSGYAPVSANAHSTGSWTTRQFDVNNASDFNGLINTINGLSNRNQFYQAYDTNGDGTITAAEMGNSLFFNSTAGNSEGQYNYYRITMTRTGDQNQKLQTNSFYVQDDVRYGRFNFNVGLRAEKYEHFSTSNNSIFAFDWTWAPRLSAAYDIKGDGRQKASAYWGRYFDPIRMDMSNFAGTTSGSTREEQVYINNQWVTYRVRGFSPIPDGLFAPSTKTPYTDELQLMYEADLGNNQSASVTYYNRRTRDIFEDFDPTIYTVPSAYTAIGGVGNPNAPDSLFLGWDYLGFDPNNPPAANFFLGTLEGGKRDYNGLELVYRKRFAQQWQSLVSYSYLDAQGNTVSDGNADFAGDVFWLDPRAPNMQGTIPGTIHNLFKGGGSYTFNMGLELGGTFSWNSGSIVNKTQLASNRRLPIRVAAADAFLYGGLLERWVDPSAVAATQNPSYGKFDMRARYLRRINRLTAEITFDVFNLFDNQGAIRIEDLAAGSGTSVYGSEIQWLNPRSALLGFRLSF